MASAGHPQVNENHWSMKDLPLETALFGVTHSSMAKAVFPAEADDVIAFVS
jgi:hypothetical protein